MENAVVFFNSFLSYIVLMVIILIVGGIAVTIGLTLAKRKNTKAAKTEEEVQTQTDENA